MIPCRRFPALFRLAPLALLAGVAATLVRGSAPAAPRPNFVLFLTDDQPYAGLGCTSDTGLRTPAMDQLVSEGINFERAFVTTAICCSSRASLLTGQHLRRHGIDDFQKPLSREQLQQTFPALLRRAGYRTAFLGKYAIGSPKIDPQLALPADLFDHWYGFPQSIAFKQRVDGQDRYLTTVMTEHALDFLRTTPPGRPFCLIVALKEPHGPLNYFDPEFQPPPATAPLPRPPTLTRAAFESRPAVVRGSLGASPQWIDSPTAYEDSIRQRNAYLARADLAVAKIRQALATQGLERDTVIVFTSDNGSMAGAHGLSGKWLMYEESIRVPLIVVDPRLPAATRGRRTAMALNIDLAPTILALAGLPAPASMQGVDLQPVLRDPTAQVRTDWYYEHVYSDPARRPIPRVEGVRTERWKYTRYPDTNPLVEELFDLAVDPREERNLAGAPARRATLAELRARCDELRGTLR